MVNVMCGRGQQGSRLVLLIQQIWFLFRQLLKEHCCGLHYVSSVCTIVVTVADMVIGLDNNQPLFHSALVDLEGIEYVELLAQLHAQVDKRPLLGDFLQSKYVKMPVQCAF